MKCNHEYTDEKLRKLLSNLYWFSGESCSKCKKTVNVLKCSASSGWFCECGDYNVNTQNNTIPHETPDLGPTWARIQAAINDIKADNAHHALTGE